jgi:hypothetical protein
MHLHTWFHYGKGEERTSDESNLFTRLKTKTATSSKHSDDLTSHCPQESGKRSVGHEHVTWSRCNESEETLNDRRSMHTQTATGLPSPASLLGLPRELRDIIYTEVCCDWSYREGASSLLSTCQQVYHEVLRMAYKNSLARVSTRNWWYVFMVEPIEIIVC